MKTNQKQKNIPDGWIKAKLGQYFDITSSRRVFQDEWRSSGVPFYRAREFVLLAKNGFVDNELFISQEMFAEYSEKYGTPKEGDLLVTGVGTIGITYLVKANDEFYFKDGNVIWFKNRELVSSKFVQYAFETRYVKKQVVGGAAITTVATYTIDNAKNTIVNLPPTPEQNRIIAVLETWDEAIEKLKQKIAIKKQIKKGLMQELLTGKTRLPGFSKEWHKYELENLMAPTKEKYNPQTEKVSYKCIELEHLQKEHPKLLGYVDSSEQKSIKNIFSPGDVLFGKLRPYLKKFFQPDFMGVCSTEIWVLKSTLKLENDYQYYLIQTKKFADIASVSSGTHMPRADWKHMRSITFSVPERSEQKAIANVLIAADEEITILEQKLTLWQEQKKYLLNNLVTGQIRTPDNLLELIP